MADEADEADMADDPVTGTTSDAPVDAAGNRTPTDGFAADQVHFVYFGDPMCSWCYGFAPTMKAVADHFAGRVPLRVVLGGLRAGNTQALRM
ncbi:MAG: hypothetical protein AAGJ53_10305 [Pseudomonadota bacterium]